MNYFEPSVSSLRLVATILQLGKLTSAADELHMILRILASAGIAIAEPMMVKQMPTIHAMVAEELGVSLIPQLSFAGGRACRTLPLKPRLFRHIGMIRSTNYVPIPATEAWLSLVRTRVQQANKVPSKPSGTARRIAG